MAFAPPKKTFTPGDSSDSPVRGRLARAAVGAAGGASFGDHDGLMPTVTPSSEASTFGWWSLRTPRVRPASRPSRRYLSPGRERPGPSASTPPRVRRSRTSCARASISRNVSTPRTAISPRRSAQARRRRTEHQAPPPERRARAQMRRRGDSRGRRPQELGRRVELADAPSVRAKARANRPRRVRRRRDRPPRPRRPPRPKRSAQIDANADRIERAKTYAAERDKLPRDSTTRSRAPTRIEMPNATLEAELAASRASEKAAREASAAAEKTRARRAFERRRTRRRWRRRAGNWRSAPRRWRTRRDAEETSRRRRRALFDGGDAARDADARGEADARGGGAAAGQPGGELEGERRRKNWRRTRRRLADWRRRARRRRRRRRPPRRRRRPPRRPGVGRWKRGVRGGGERGANRGVSRVCEAAAKKQIDRQERVIELEEKLRDARKVWRMPAPPQRRRATSSRRCERWRRRRDACGGRWRRRNAAFRREARRRRPVAQSGGGDGRRRRRPRRTQRAPGRRRRAKGLRRHGRTRGTRGIHADGDAAMSSFTGDADDARAAAKETKTPRGSADVATEVATPAGAWRRNAHVAVLADSRDRARWNPCGTRARRQRLAWRRRREDRSSPRRFGPAADQAGVSSLPRERRGLARARR